MILPLTYSPFRFPLQFPVDIVYQFLWGDTAQNTSTRQLARKHSRKDHYAVDSSSPPRPSKYSSTPAHFPRTPRAARPGFPTVDQCNSNPGKDVISQGGDL